MSKFFLLLILLLTLLLSSCYKSFYQSKTVSQKNRLDSTLDSILVLVKSNYIILHAGDGLWHIKSIHFSRNKDTLKCFTEAVSPDYQKYILNKTNNDYHRYKRNKAKLVLSQIHLYAKEIEEDKNEFAIKLISMNEIEQVNVYEPARAQTIVSYVFSTIVIIVPVTLSLWLIHDISVTYSGFH